MEKLKLHVISHTHWDREWYQTFQNYRYRLVRVMDNLLDNMEADEEYRVFHLDGQTIVLEDYLEIRPENADRLAKLIRDGRLRIGPWYVMPDEFLVSGESLVRNLRMGHRISRKYGVEPMKNGYVTDIFGHNSQLPQILNGFDIHSATLYRGIGDYEKDAFRWVSPDGSEVVAAKLEAERSYSNFYFAVRWPYEEDGFDPEDAVERMKVLVERARKMAASDMVLMMDGVDHGGMEPDLHKMLKLFEEKIPDIEFVHAGIEEYFDQIRTESLDTIEGALYNTGRRGTNNQLLKNVLSSMVHIKQANDRCETYLTTVSEPLNAFCEILSDRLKSYRRDDYSLSPRRSYLDRAWKYLIMNHPHDSICGCSISDVHRDNEYRYRQAQQMAEISAGDCIRLLARNIRPAGNHQEAVLLYNPTQRRISGIQVFTLPVRYHADANRRFYDSEDRLMDVQVLDEELQNMVKERLLQLVHFETYSYLTVAAHIDIPAFGYTVICCDNLQNTYAPVKPYGPEKYFPPLRLPGSQMTAHNRIDNGVLTVELNPAGLLDVTVHSSGHCYRNLHVLENRSDVGEGWNWRPAVYDSTVWGDNSLDQFSVVSDGPLCTVWKLTYALRLPEGIEADGKRRSEREHRQYVTTWMTVPKDSRTICFRTVIDNKTENNRMRVLFPAGLDADSFYTKTPFDFAKWPVHHADTRDYAEPDTLVHPAQGIAAVIGKAAADAGSNAGPDDSTGGGAVEAVSLYSRGLYEVEVTDNGEKALALTLFRAAQSEHGSLHPEDIKMQRKITCEYAVSFICGEPACPDGAERDSRESDSRECDGSILTDIMTEGEAYRAGVQSFAFEINPEAEVLPAEMALLEAETGDKVISAVYEQDGKIYVRLYDVSGKAGTAVLRFAGAVKKAEYVNLDHKVLGTAVSGENSVTVECPAHKIVTVCVEI